MLGTWHATRTIQECREACGGAGYLAANRFAALKADTDVFTTFEGDNHVLLQLVAKGLLTDYASDFEDLDQFGMVRFVASMAVETVIEKTNVHKLLTRLKDVLPGGDEWDQEAGLLDPNYQLAMLRFREEHMLAGVARRLKRGIDDGLNPGEVFSRVQDHVIAVANAHVERLVLEAFVGKVRAIAAEPSADLKVALGLLCDLFALTTIESDRAWFMEHGRLSSARSKAISREVNDLCRKIRPLAQAYVDALGVPREMLRAPELLGPAVAGPGVRRILGPGSRTRCGRRRTTGSSSTRASAACSGGSAPAARSPTCTPPPTRSAACPPGRGCSTCRAVAGWRCAGCARPGRRVRRRGHRPGHARSDRRGSRAPGRAGPGAHRRARTCSTCPSPTSPSTWSCRSPACTSCRIRCARCASWRGCSGRGVDSPAAR